MSSDSARPYADLVEAVVEGVVRALALRSSSGGLLTTSEVARNFGVSDAWVRQHAEELGVRRLGSGTKPRLRFDSAVVRDRLCSCSSGRRSQEVESPARTPTQQKPRQRSLGSNRDLLPVRPPKPARGAVRDRS